MSLRLNMILGIGAILLLVIAGYAIMTVRSQSSHLKNLTQREAELIALLAERAIARAMTEGKSKEVQGILEEIGALPYLDGIRVVDSGGRTLLVGKGASPGIGTED